MASTIIRVHYTPEPLTKGAVITIRGNCEGLNWNQGVELDRMDRRGASVWLCMLPVKDHSVTLEFKPLLNDEMWCKGANFIVKAGETIDVYPYFKSKSGRVLTSVIESACLNSVRRLAIYVPPSYHENIYKMYPLFIMQGGKEIFDDATSEHPENWGLKAVFDKLCNEGGIEETVIVAPYCSNPDEPAPEYPPADDIDIAQVYLSFVMLELIPMMRRQYRVFANDEHLVGIGGGRPGGAISYSAWLKQPWEFGRCVAFSPTTSHDNSILFQYSQTYLSSRPSSHKLYIDHGEDDDMDATAQLITYLDTRKDILENSQIWYRIMERVPHMSVADWTKRAPRAFGWILADPQRIQYDNFNAGGIFAGGAGP